MTGTWEPTVLPWKNVIRQVRRGVDRDGIPNVEERGVKVMALSQPMTAYERGSKTGLPGCHPGLVCARHTDTLVMDVDDHAFHDSELGRYFVERGFKPWSTRGASYGRANAHYVFDATNVEGWVKQGPIVGGDIKSNGFIPLPGTPHWTGDLYEPQLDENGNLPVNTLTQADLEMFIAARSHRIGGASGSHTGQDLGNGQEPQLLSYTGKLVRGGFPEEEAWNAWLAKAQSFDAADASWPWTAEDRDVFDRHWAYCTAQQDRPAAPVSSLTPAQLAWATGTQLAQPEVVTSDPGALLQDARHLVRQANERLRAQLGNGWHVTVLTENVRGKLSSEMHVHPKSTTWRSAPDGTQKLYEVIMERLNVGEELTEAWLTEYDHFELNPATGELITFDKSVICAWLSSPEHPLLALHEGLVVPISDELFDDSQLSAAAQLDKRYPGWTLEMPDPKAGASWTKETHVAAAKIAFELVVERGGRNVNEVEGLTKLERLSHADLARALNDPTNRARFPELADRRAAGRSQAAAILKRLQDPEDHLMGQLREDGTWAKRPCETCQDHHAEIVACQIHVALEAETWREGHHWMGAPKGYGCGSDAWRRSQRQRDRDFIDEGLADRRREAAENLELYAAWMGGGNADHLL